MAKTVSWQAASPEAIARLKEWQNEDGGWGSLPEEPSNTKHTSLSIQALIAAGESPMCQEVLDAVLYLQERQSEDAGFASSASVPASDPESTSAAIQALLAAGEELLNSKWHRSAGTPFDALLAVQGENGSFGSSVGTTSAAIPGLVGRSLPFPGRRLAAVKGLEWLHSQQMDDGGFGNGGFTADAVYAIALCDQDPGGPEWAHPVTNKTPLEALEAQTNHYVNSAPAGGPAGELSKVIRAVNAAGGTPYSFAGMDLVGQLKEVCNEYSPKCHPSKVFSHGLALIALQAADETIPSTAVGTLEEAQLDDGGWPWAWPSLDSNPEADVDSTGLSIQAIVAGGGPSSPLVIEGFSAFAESVRFANGAYPDVPARPDPNCNSTALAIEGLLAAGRHRDQPLIIPLDTGATISSWDALLGFQEPSGSFAFTSSRQESRLVATLEAIRALMSPFYPDYQPTPEANTTKAGREGARSAPSQAAWVVAPFSGDHNYKGPTCLSHHHMET